MKLTPSEKLTLLMLADIHKHLKIEGEIDPDFVINAVNGDSWALTWKYSGLSSEEPSEEIIEETANILTMWRAIDNTVDALSKADRDTLEKQVAPHSLTFEGFDANNDEHYGVARFMIEKLERFEERKGAYLNSHSQASLERYRRMYPRYRDLGRVNGWKFTKDDLVTILKN